MSPTQTEPDKTGSSGIDQDAFLALREEGKSFAWTERDTLLYALAAGMGRDQVDPRELAFVYENENFVALPTLPVVVARSMLARTLPINLALMLHAEQTLVLHGAMPTSGTILADTRITQILDKGAGKGALIYSETVGRQTADGAPLFTLGMVIFARGDGGFGGSSGPAPTVRTLPERPPELVHDTQTRPDQALLYRLTGDRNPLHADPEFARRAGFPAPILHGLCTYAIACRAVLASVCDYDPMRIAQFDVRFTSPVYPGDRIETDIWRDGNLVAFRCRVPERNVVVLNNGYCVLR